MGTNFALIPKLSFINYFVYQNSYFVYQNSYFVHQNNAVCFRYTMPIRPPIQRKITWPSTNTEAVTGVLLRPY